MTTKERITEAALILFSEKSYKGTSVKNIADAVGIKDASLYNHFKGKQEIFDSIVALVNEHISSLSEQLELPKCEESNASSHEFLKRLDLEHFKELSKKVFIFYLTDPYISKFWRVANMEQYQNEQIYGMFRKIFIDDAINYQTQLFETLMNMGVFRRNDPRVTAINFYSPIFMLLTRYSFQLEKIDEALEILDKQIEEFYHIYGGAQNEKSL